MRSSAAISCSLIAACASATRDDGTAPGDGGLADASIAVPDGPPDPRRGWIDLGSPPGATAGDVMSPRLALWNGAPVAAYSADNHVRVVAYHNDAVWLTVGPPMRHSTAAHVVTYDPTPVVGTDGLAVVWPEWSEGAMTSAVRRHASGSWVPPPGAATVGSANAYSFLPHSTAAVDSDGAMWIAYAETTALNDPMRIFVVSLLGANLYQRGASISATASNTGAIAPNLAIGGGSQFLIWTEDGVRFAKRNPATGAWDAFGGSPIAIPGRPVGNHSNGHVAVDSAGRPIIAFTSSDGNDSGIYVARWDGGAWTYWHQMLQATPGQVAGMNTYANLHDLVAAGPDVAYVAWSEVDASTHDGVYVYRCTPSGCAPVGRGRLEAAAGATPGYGPRLVVDGAGRPLVTWVEDDPSGNARAHVWRYHGDPDQR